MDIDSAIEKRHSANSFDKKKVSWKIVLEAIEAANQAPFAGNQNHLKFVIVEDPEKIKNLAKHSNQDLVSEASIVIAVCSEDTKLENLFGERGRIYGKQQTGAAIENFLLKIEDLGLASCWIGAYEDEMIRSTLKIPEHIEIEALLPIGHEKKLKGKKKSKKKELEQTIYWDSWKTKKRPTVFPDPKLRSELKYQ
jgi:nitroreductase